MKQAVISFQGHQYLVREGDHILVDKLENNKKTIDVLLVEDGGSIKIGNPTLKEYSIGVKILEQVKGEKIKVATFKAKSRYRRVKGSRSLKTNVEITGINKTVKK